MELDVVQSNGGHDGGESTEVGSYFVANYPPFSVWSADHLSSVEQVLSTPMAEGGTSAPPLGLYLHIPFCRKRCKFCYFRVYTDKNSSDVDVYLRALAKEAQLYSRQEALQGREFDFVYFGGGTPSFLSSEQLKRLIDRISESWNWSSAREVTFECEPGTLKKSKLQAIKDIGVTRLSLGVEHFDDEILSLGGRAHKSPEIFQAYQWAREVGFDQINIDLIAGMVGETDDKWKDAVEKALAFQPDSLTVYQMEIPYNTVVARDSKTSGSEIPVASWDQKRAWVNYAFDQFERDGYVVSSAYTMVKPSPRSGFVYRDALWQGADMVGTGVASFSHLSGVHYQNMDQWEDYTESLLQRDALPLARALPMTDHQLLIREMILQLKLGKIDAGYFQNKFGVQIAETFSSAFDSLRSEKIVTINDDEISLSREGLLRVDSLLPRFFESEFQNIRYT